MIYFCGVIIALIANLLPWWTSIILALLIGYWLCLDWKKSFTLSVIVAVVEVGVAILMDQQLHGLITKRIGGVFGVPPQAIFVVMAAVVIWQILIFARLGSALRALRNA